MKLLIKFVGFLFIILFYQHGYAQKSAPNQKDFKLTIKPTKIPIKLDGVMDEAAWNTVTAVTNFKKKFPTDIGEAKKPNRSQIFI